MKKVMAVVIGALLIALGVLFGLKELGVLQADISLDGWWALFLIVPGAVGIFTSRDKIGNIIVTLIGVYLLLAARGVIGYGDFRGLLVPAIIVLLGVKVIISAFSGKKSEPKNGVAECSSSFETKEESIGGKAVTVARVSAVFGGTKCNLSDTDFSDGGEINLFCLFGGADLIVPENVEIKINAFCLFGGISDKRNNPGGAKSASVTVNGFCIFGGADIK